MAGRESLLCACVCCLCGRLHKCTVNMCSITPRVSVHDISVIGIYRALLYVCILLVFACIFVSLSHRSSI